MFLSPKDMIFEFGFMPGQKVADIGAGTGHFALALARILGENARIYAVDIREEPLIRLKKTASEEGLRNVDVIQGDAERPYGTHLRTELLNGAVLSNVLFQIEDRKALLAELDRIVARKGRVAVVEWKNKLKKAEVQKLFEERGFTLERGFDAGEHHYVLIFKK